MEAGQPQAATEQGPDRERPGRRVKDRVRDGWVGPPRPSKGIAVSAVLFALLATRNLLGWGRGAEPVEGLALAGLAVLLGAEFAGEQRRGLVTGLRLVGGAVAAVGIAALFVLGP